MNERISNSSKRLQEMMEIMKLKQSDIVEKTGITKSALSNYIHGTREPRQDKISKISDPFGINPAWLMGYDVPMYMAELDGSDINEEKLIKMWRNATEEEKIFIMRVLSATKGTD